jgi:hypothetical protein
MIEALVTSLWQCKHLLNGCDDVILSEGWEEKGKRMERERESGTLQTSLIFVLMAYHSSVASSQTSNSGGQQMFV